MVTVWTSLTHFASVINLSSGSQALGLSDTLVKVKKSVAIMGLGSGF